MTLRQAAERAGEQEFGRRQADPRLVKANPLPVGFFEHDEQERVVVATIDDSRKVVQGLQMCQQIEAGEVVPLSMDVYADITLFLADLTCDEYTQRPTREKATGLLVRLDAAMRQTAKATSERVTPRVEAV